MYGLYKQMTEEESKPITIFVAPNNSASFIVEGFPPARNWWDFICSSGELFFWGVSHLFYAF